MGDAAQRVLVHRFWLLDAGMRQLNPKRNLEKAPTLRKLEFAKKLRDNATWFETRLWKRLKKGIKGVKFENQVVIRGYIVDFYCPKVRLAIELDGRQHDIQRDSTRDSHIALANVSVMRFPNPVTQVQLNNIIFKVWAECRYRLKHPESTYSLPSSFQKEKEREKRQPRITCGNVEIQGCPKQVFATMEVAINTARRFKALHICAQPFRCSECGSIHLEERREIP